MNTCPDCALELYEDAGKKICPGCSKEYKKCCTCGSTVELAGDLIKYYVSVNGPELATEILRLEEEIFKLKEALMECQNDRK